MKRIGLIGLALFVALALASLTVACGGGREQSIEGGELALRSGRYCPPEGDIVPKSGPDSVSMGGGLGIRGCLRGTSYRVTKVATAASVGSGSAAAKADGVFVIVDVTLKNEKVEPGTISADLMRIRGGNGAEYTTSTAANIAVDNGPVLREEIPSETPTTLRVVYDLPEDAVKGAQFVVRDFWSDMTGTIDLGL
jgi:hypothetical protein